MAALEKNVMVRNESSSPSHMVGFHLKYVSPLLGHAVSSLKKQWWEEDYLGSNPASVN